MVLLGASIDDLLAITLFTLFLDLSRGSNVNLIKSLLSLPISFLLGIVPGIIIGFFLVWFFKKYHTKVRATEKMILLIGISVMLLQIGDWIHTAALLGIMTIGYILLEKDEGVAHEL